MNLPFNLTDHPGLSDARRERDDEAVLRQGDSVGALDKLLLEVKSLGSRENVIGICEMAIRLRTLAPFNAMLVYMQRPDATMVLGAEEWKALERQPKPKTRPIVTLRPFGPVDFVYDVSDTDGEGVPEQLSLGNLGGNAFGVDGILSHEHLAEFFVHCRKHGIVVDERPMRVMKAGHAIQVGDAEFEIELNVDHRPEQKFSTLCHELAHIFCGHLGAVPGLTVDHSRRGHDCQETEAELTAYLVARRFGVEPKSAEYLKWYSSDGRVPEFSLECVLVAAGKIEALLRGDLRRKK